MWCARLLWVFCVCGSGWARWVFVSRSHWCLHYFAGEPHSLIWDHADKCVLVVCCWLCLDWKCHHTCKTRELWDGSCSLVTASDLYCEHLKKKKERKKMRLFIDQNAEHNFLHLLKITPISIETAPKQTEITAIFYCQRSLMRLDSWSESPGILGKIT